MPGRGLLLGLRLSGPIGSELFLCPFSSGSTYGSQIHAISRHAISPQGCWCCTEGRRCPDTDGSYRMEREAGSSASHGTNPEAPDASCPSPGKPLCRRSSSISATMGDALGPASSLPTNECRLGQERAFPSGWQGVPRRDWVQAPETFVKASNISGSRLSQMSGHLRSISREISSA